jgi:hypothetical protein
MFKSLVTVPPQLDGSIMNVAVQHAIFQFPIAFERTYDKGFKFTVRARLDEATRTKIGEIIG